MEGASPWKDLDDKFCLCSICLELLKEPKLMPCLHRYCKDCLDSIIRESHDIFRCPECREEIQIPINGVDGFKTDLFSKSLVEYVQIQQSLKSDEVRECYSCSKHLRVAAYCFKCNNFLCKDCYNFHVKNKTVKDHSKHTLSVKDIESKNITVERLGAMRDAPRCKIHPERKSELYCETCSNTPVCLACVYGEHKAHSIHEVKSLAKFYREELSKRLETLERIKKDKKHLNHKQIQEKLTLNVNIEKEKLAKTHNEKVREVMMKIQDTGRRQERVKREKQSIEKKMLDYLQREMKREIDGIKKKYEEIFKVKKSEIKADFLARESSLAKELTHLCDKLQRFDRDKKELLESIENQLDERVRMIGTISESFDNKEKRIENINVMASTILASENDWSAVQCIPEICTAATNLLEDLKKDFPEMTSLSDVTVNYKESPLGKTSISKLSHTVGKELTIDYKYHYFNGVTSSGDGNIVISGSRCKGKETFIIVIELTGKITKQKKLRTELFGPFHCCDILSSNKVISVCSPHKLVLHDMRDGSHVEKNINDVINSWPKGRRVRCVAADPVNNHILVGGYNSRDVYLFDDQLNYLHILTLPKMIKWPKDMTVSDGHLLVCDYDGKKAYVTTMEGTESKVVSEFLNPDLEGDNWGPSSICRDTTGALYMLWTRKDRWGGQRSLVQYTHDGRQVVATRKMDRDAFSLAAIETSVGGKLVVVTQRTQKVYIYDLLKDEPNYNISLDACNTVTHC